MTNWIIVVTCIAAVLITVGCISSADNVKEHPVAEVFKTALSVAAKILANDGTQKLAIAAAQAAVISQIPEPAAQAAACSAIAAVVPEVANGISQLLSRGDTKRERMDDRYEQYTRSEAFNEMILKCTQEYNQMIK